MSSPRTLLLPALLSSWLVPLSASAQEPIQDPSAANRTPNVLLIVDTSGSMENKSASDAAPICVPGGVSERSRWVDVVEVLTGTITDYSCEALDRSQSSFKALYEYPDGTPAIDADYRNAFHRPLSGGCAAVPATTGLPSDPFTWVAPAFQPYNGGPACNFLQSPDGLIDSLGDIVRFGLMTFDTLPGAGTGYSGLSRDYASGAAGAWSYFLNGAPSMGHPVDCFDSQLVEVGARNAAAPAWEGKMIAFGNPNASLDDNKDRHTKIEQILLSSRPYGATPIAGALHDARNFLWNDNTTEPLDPSKYFGPEGGTDPNVDGDPYVKNGCRKEYIVLLTDGEPNLDLRPYCEQLTASADPSLDGACPFDKPEEITHDLRNPGAGHAQVTTYVVGFAADVAAGGTQQCQDLTATELAAGGLCDLNAQQTTPDKALQVCCTLQRIAYNGGTEKAYFASNAAALRTELSKVFSDIVTGGVASATQPVSSPGVGAVDTSAVGFRILTSYSQGGAGDLWRGNVERMRWTCDTDTNLPVPQPMEADKGDDFSANVSASPSTRTIVSFEPSLAGTSDQTLRPNYAGSVPDGLGALTGQQVAATGSGFVSAINASALHPDASAGKTCQGLSAEACRDLILSWSLGFSTGSDPSRCPSLANCSLVADVVHSTPVIVNRPSAAVADESYEDFALANNGRPMMVYTSSNDGYLHGFQLSPNSTDDIPAVANQNNEKFAFLPPAVLPMLQSQYPSAPLKLLDGAPVVMDVVAEPDTGNTYYPFKLQRGAAVAAEAGSATGWRTILVQGFGGTRSGYFAIDITNPKDPTTPANGPRFLWQLTTDENGKPLFGLDSLTPLITTIFDDASKTEIAVAVLPGGYGGPTGSGTCLRSSSSPYGNIQTGFEPRNRVRCYNFDPTNDGVTADDTLTYVGARSLTIVRLDSGEILRTFRREAAEVPSIPAGLVVPTLLDSPLTGIPAAYPAGVGAVADRIFIGDQDGTLWRVDVSGSPNTWSMNLFFDGFSRHPNAADSTAAAAAGRPISTRPMLSVDTRGQITVAFSTGDQSVSGSAGEEQYVWSLLEQRNAAGSTDGTFQSTVLWWHELLDGEHVLGPLQLFGENLYYSSYLPIAGGSDPCATMGQSRLWGVHYMRPLTGAADGNGGDKALSYNLSGTDVTEQATALMDGVVFGVNLDFLPTCFAADPTLPDPALGRPFTGTPSPPQMQLVFQTTNSGKASPVTNFKTEFGSLNLAQPQNASTIESWAAILE